MSLWRRVRSLRCSFCGRREDEVAGLVAGPRVTICDACVEIARRIIEEAGAGPASSEAPGPRSPIWRRSFGCLAPALGRRGGARRVAEPEALAACGARLVGSALAVAFLAASPGSAGAPRGQAGGAQIPKVVMDALTARFPKAIVETWTREEEKGTVIYDIEFRQGGRKGEADIRQDGTFVNWEEAIPASELPGAVRRAVDGKYPGSRIVELMRITAVTDGKEALEGYEITLETAGKKTVELTVAPDGRIVEESAVGTS